MHEREHHTRPADLTVLTVGHSTRDLQDFFALLRAHGVQELVDVRTIPKSRRNPQFNTSSLSVTAPEAGFKYVHVPELGGLRRPVKDSINTGWRNLSFRGYADYMQSESFMRAVEELENRAQELVQVLMCAEAVHWRCHRSLIADALLVRGVRVEHISTTRKRQQHRLTPFARVKGTTITYPSPTGDDSPQASRDDRASETPPSMAPDA